MTLQFTVSGRIARPVHEMYEAVVDPDQLSHYFTTGGAQGRLETGTTVQWDFADFPGAFPVYVTKVDRDRRIVLRWQAESGDDTTVTMHFESLEDGRTLVSITEEGWPETDQGQKLSYGNCEGWTGMLCAMKVWMEHDINLRDGFYK